MSRNLGDIGISGALSVYSKEVLASLFSVDPQLFSRLHKFQEDRMIVSGGGHKLTKPRIGCEWSTRYLPQLNRSKPSDCPVPKTAHAETPPLLSWIAKTGNRSSIDDAKSSPSR